jgi:hypothetical protein
LPERSSASIAQLPIAGLLAWLVPGLGHLYLGHRTRGLVFLVTVTVTFWSGVAIGGVRGTIDSRERRLWFVAQVCSGGNAAVGWFFSQQLAPKDRKADNPASKGPWASAEVGVHYTGVAGLLNLLVILDAIGRAEGASANARARREQTESSG